MKGAVRFAIPPIPRLSPGYWLTLLSPPGPPPSLVRAMLATPDVSDASVALRGGDICYVLGFETVCKGASNLFHIIY